jgi:hypothetical protein
MSAYRCRTSYTAQFAEAMNEYGEVITLVPGADSAMMQSRWRPAVPADGCRVRRDLGERFLKRRSSGGGSRPGAGRP